ncbi:MAG: putative DNA binding domain-containing protein [Planctomycetaceae bacterium]|jgi:ATP-dependent DNA helicase RecG|nr:putative DNA binding domain-containing protein [Planctomycetaceae bacterium]
MNFLPQQESQTVEFKTTFSDEVIVSLVAFSNAEGGVVYVGVADDGTAKGILLRKETVAQWINEIKNKTSPIIIPDVEILEADGKNIAVFKVSEYPIKPVAMKGRYYKRVKNANQLLSVTEVVNLHLQSLNTSWDAYPDPLHTLDEISLDKVQRVIGIMKENHLTVNESPLPFLLKHDLIREDRPTNAAYLMFKKKDSVDTTIELGRFQDAITIKDSARTQSDIITQVDEVLDYVKKHINVEIIITGEARNTQKWQYPLEAIREIVLNMIIHRDYRSSSDSIIKIFNDKIEFYNPGTLPEGLTIEKLLTNDYKSTPRNKNVADVFKNMGIIEKYGSGIHRIINYFKEENLPLPEFKNISVGFQVTVFAVELSESIPKNESGGKKIKNGGKKATKAKVAKTSGIKVTKKENAPPKNKGGKKSGEKNKGNKSSGKKNSKDSTTAIVLSIIKDNNTISISQLSEKVNINSSAIQKHIQKLKAKGLLERVGPDKGGYWKVIEK